MADDDTERDATRPSLEAPRLFGRRRGARAERPEPAAADEPVFTDSGTTSTTDTTVDEVPVVADAPAPRRRRAPRERPARTRTGPPLEGLPAAAVVGALSGLGLVALTWVGLRGCEAVRGTTSCGTAPGMAALVVVFVLAVVIGTLLSKAFRLPDPGPSSFLAIGMTSVICLLFLVDVLDHWSMVIVVPALTAGTFALSWWVTTTYVDPD